MGSAEPQILGACIWNAASRARFCSLGTSTLEAALQYSRRLDPIELWPAAQLNVPEWAPSGRMLLLMQHSSCQGVLRIFDIHGDRVVVEPAYTTTARSVPAAWHPSSEGIVCGSHTALQDAGAFADAQIANGRLPDQCQAMLGAGLGFFMNAQPYLAPMDAE